MYPSVNPIIVQFGPFALRWYGLLMAIALLVGVQIASAYLKRKGHETDDFWDMLLWVLLPAFLGARLYYVLIQSPRTAEGIGRYLKHPIEIVQIWGGGIHIFGGLIAGGIALWLFAKIRRLPTLIYLDAILLGLPLAQAIGRWGNFINQELYGPPTQWPLGLRIDAAHRIPPYNDVTIYPERTRFHPLFLYESVWNLIGFGLLFWISRRFNSQLKAGDIALLYLIWYPTGRFFIELLRTDSWFFPGTPFNVVHILSFIAAVGSAIALYWRHRSSQLEQAAND